MAMHIVSFLTNTRFVKLFYIFFEDQLGNSIKQQYVCGIIVGKALAQPIYKEAWRVQAL